MVVQEVKLISHRPLHRIDRCGGQLVLGKKQGEKKMNDRTLHLVIQIGFVVMVVCGFMAVATSRMENVKLRRENTKLKAELQKASLDAYGVCEEN